MINFGRQILKNIFASWGGYIGRVIIAFFFIPFITATLGEARYGIWVILFQLVNYLSLLDLGLERAVTRYISKHFALNDFKAINRTISASTRIYIVLGLIVLGGSFLISKFLLPQFIIGSPEQLEDAKSAIIIIGLFLSFRFWLLPMGGNLHSFQRADIGNLLSFSEELLRAVLLTVLLYLDYSLTSLATGILGLSILRQVLSAIWLRRKFTELRFRLSNGDPGTYRTLYQYSRYSFGIALSAILLYGSDSVLLGFLLSTSAAGIYAPGAQLILYTRQIINSAAAVLTPAISQLESEGDWESIRQLYLISIKYSTYFSITAAIGIFLYAGPFVNLWLQPAFEASAEVMIILSFGSMFFLTQIIGNSILFAVEQHKYLLFLTLAEAFCKIIIAFSLIETYGLLSIAWATSVPQILFYAIIYPILMSRVLKLKVFDIWRVMGRPLGFGCLLLLPLGWLVSYLLPVIDWFSLILNVSLLVIAGLGLIRLAFDPAEAAFYTQLNDSSRARNQG